MWVSWGHHRGLGPRFSGEKLIAPQTSHLVINWGHAFDRDQEMRRGRRVPPRFSLFEAWQNLTPTLLRGRFSSFLGVAYA